MRESGVRGRKVAVGHDIDRMGYVMVLSATVAWSTGGFFARLRPQGLYACLFLAVALDC